MAKSEVSRQQGQQAEGTAEQKVAAPTPEGAERTRMRRAYAPRTDIYETDDGIVLMVDMPGVGSDAADLTLEKNVLTIRGQTSEVAPQGFSPVYREYEPGDYERVFTLSDEVDAGRIEAKVKDGVLRVFLPKAGPAETKRIQVRAS